MMIPVVSLKSVNARHTKELNAAAKRVIESGWYILGEELKAFEHEYAEYCGSRYCIGVGSGLDALTLILKAWKALGFIADGDEVILPANAYVASVLAVTENNLKPVFVEPSERHYGLDAIQVERKISSKVKVIMPVHLYGQLPNMASLEKLASKYNLLLLEDAAQAHGAEFNHKKAGNWGNASAFSFYPTKNLGALGDAGAITTNDESLTKMLYTLRNYGSPIKYKNSQLGINSRLDEMQAAFLRVKLKSLNDDNEHRREIAARYIKGIINPVFILPMEEKNTHHVWHLFVVRVINRDEVRKKLLEEGVQTDIHYPIIPSRQEAYCNYNFPSFPLAEKMSREVLSLPISSVMTLKEADEVVRVVNKLNVIS